MLRGGQYPFFTVLRRSIIENSSVLAGPSSDLMMVAPAPREVQVFYRAANHGTGHDDAPEWHATGLASQLPLTAGWLDALALSSEESAGLVHIRYTHQSWCDSYGVPMDTTPEGCLDDWIAPSLVRPRAAATHSYRISFLAVRCGGSEVLTTTENWGPTNSSVSTTYINALFAQAHAMLGANYCVYSAFVSSAADLRALAETAVETAATLRRQAARVCAMYFLWPATYADDYVAGGQLGDDGQPVLALGGGYVEAAPLIALMRRLEAVAVPTRFPHPSPLYEMLVSKSWQPALCSQSQLSIPPTTAVPTADIVADPEGAAWAALLSLQQVATAVAADRECVVENGSGTESSGSGTESSSAGNKRHRRQAMVQAATDASIGDDSGGGGVVVKLGYSWEAADVLILRTPPALTPRRLGQALHTAISARLGCSNEQVLVQAFVPTASELRLFVVDGVIRARYFARYLECAQPPTAQAAAAVSVAMAARRQKQPVAPLPTGRGRLERSSPPPASLVVTWLRW
jgi:hypothetical protein